MIQLRKIALSALAVFAFASCAASENSAATKSTLEGKGFTVSVQSADTYKQTAVGKLLKLDNLVDYLSATKVAAGGESATAEGFFVWFMKDIDSASNFVSENIRVISTLEESVSGFSMGSRNNAAWCGTKAVAVSLGWTAA